MGWEYSQTRRTARSTELMLGAAFLAVVAAVFVARESPATGFERSIYASTPLFTWVFLGVALLVATSVATSTEVDRFGRVALVLGGTAVTAVLSMPIIRGYYFLGGADSLTHLGWTKDLAADVLDPHALFYPAFHTISVAIGRLAGISFEHAVMLTTVVLFLPFLVFVPLTVKAVTGDLRAAAVAGVVAWLVLPVNNIATYVIPHTNSLALFYVPVVLYAVTLYLTGDTQRQTTVFGVSAIGVVLAILNAALVVLHPQHALNVLLLFCAISVVGAVIRRIRPSHPVASHRPLHVQTGLFLLFIVVWIATHETANRAIDATLGSLLDASVGAGAEVAQRGPSLIAVGGSLAEIFAKLFVVSAVFALLTAGYLLAVQVRSIEADRSVRGLAVYFTAGFVVLTIPFALYFLGTPKMAFRQLGFIFVLATITGALGLASLLDRARQTVPSGRRIVTVALVVCLALSLLTVFPSPFIYKTTPGVSGQEMSGYETAFELQESDVPFATLGSPPYRFSDAIYGTTESKDMDLSGPAEGRLDSGAVNDRALGRAYPSGTYYMVLSRPDIETQVGVWNQLHYDRDALGAVASDPSANRVVANGEFELYVVTNETDAAGSS